MAVDSPRRRSRTSPKEADLVELLPLLIVDDRLKRSYGIRSRLDLYRNLLPSISRSSGDARGCLETRAGEEENVGWSRMNALECRTNPRKS